MIHPQEVARQHSSSPDALENAGPLAARKSLALESELDGTLPTVHVDERRIQQVFSNLLDNAMKFAPHHGKITVRARQSEGAVIFSVTDNGPGIAQADRAHLFDRFWQAPSAVGFGTGLGLFIARSLIESHEGRIWVDSEPGTRTTFSFLVPMARGRTVEPEASSRLCLASTRKREIGLCVEQSEWPDQGEVSHCA